MHPYLLCVSVRQNPLDTLLILVQGDIKKDKKWSFVESLKKDAFGIASLRENGILKTDTKEKANTVRPPRRFYEFRTRMMREIAGKGLKITENPCETHAKP